MVHRAVRYPYGNAGCFILRGRETTEENETTGGGLKQDEEIED